MPLDMRGKIERVLAGEALGLLGVAPLQRLDDIHVVGNRAPGAILLTDRRLADGADMDEEILGGALDGLIARKGDDRLMEFDVGGGIFVKMRFRRVRLEIMEELAQLGDLAVRRALGNEARGHAL